MTGLSILQNGKTRFLEEKYVEEILGQAEPSPCLKQLRSGLSELGLIQVCLIKNNNTDVVVQIVHYNILFFTGSECLNQFDISFKQLTIFFELVQITKK